MRISVNFTSEKEITFPLAYNYIWQSFIYRHLDEKLAQFLHDKGFASNGRNFKLFTFSRILGKVRFLKEARTFQVAPSFSIVVSSPVENFIQSLAENLVRANEIILIEQPIFIESINVHASPKLEDQVLIKMLSPVTMYSTLLAPEGRKKTYFYTPFEKDFSRLLSENLRKKYRVLYQQEPDSLALAVEPYRVNKAQEKIVEYKGTIIKGWMGTYKLSGSPELIALAYDTGLGSKNPQGFGCFEMIPAKPT